MCIHTCLRCEQLYSHVPRCRNVHGEVVTDAFREGLCGPCDKDIREYEARQSTIEQHFNQRRTTMERAVIVTTQHRGVFFGYATDTDGERISLKRARMCVYWSADVRGVVGLASSGPSAQCKIGPAADITLRDITAVMEVTPEAVARWESQPWAR